MPGSEASLLKRSGDSLVISLILLLPYFVQLLSSTYYIPGPDESFQIQGSVQMLLHKGYASATGTIPTDLSQVQLKWITGWPIAYSFVLFLLQKLGFGALVAAKFFQLGCVVLGAGGWFLVLDRLGQSKTFRCIFLFLLWAQFFSWGIYSTNAVSWALFPFLIYFFLLSQADSAALWGAGAVAALMVLFRFQNVILISTGAAVLLIQAGKPFMRRIRSAIIFSLIPSFCFFGIYFSNVAKSGQGTFLATIPVDITWHFRWVTDFTNAFLFNASFRFDEFLRAFFEKVHFPFLFTPIKYALSFVGVTFLGIICWRNRARCDRDRRTIELIFVFQLLFLVLMLFGLAVVLNVENIPNGRYYHSLFPVFVLLCLWPLRSSPYLHWLRSPRNKAALLSALFLFSFGTVSYYSFYRFRLSQAFDQRAAAMEHELETAMASAPGLPTVVFADQLFPRLGLRKDLTALYELGAAAKQGLRASGPVLLFLSSDERNPKSQFPVLVKEIESLSAKYGMKLRKEDGHTFAWNVFPAGI
ncbi:MAG TPA: hypothetical protein VIG33_10240, partial [Pseudobdellovibrionaceae bacterium]